MSARKQNASGADTIVYHIPVVVHIIHSGEPIGSFYNPSDMAVDSMIDFLNKSWAATWPFYADTNNGGVRIPIQFDLAKRDTNCNATTGIVRVDGRVLDGYEANGMREGGTFNAPDDSAIKSLGKWPTQDYYNIWIVKTIDKGNFSGYTYYPGATKYDGAVIAARYMRPLSTKVNFWYTVPHELGHAFNLYHTFTGSNGVGSCPTNINCLTDGDMICDTEPHEFIDQTCLSGINGCTGAAYKGVQNNFMNYTTCFNRFTPKQRERMIAALMEFRTGLANSLGGTAPDPSFTAPKAACIPKTIVSTDTKDIGPHNISVGDFKTSSFGYLIDGKAGYLDRTCIQAPAHLIQGQQYTISVSSGYWQQRDCAWIDYNDDGIFQSNEEILADNTITLNFRTHTDTFTVPASGVVLGKALRMRIMSDCGSCASISDPCASLQVGQTEDYSVIVGSRLGIETVSEAHIAPNPAQTVVNVNTTLAHPLIAIYSIDGKLLIRQQDVKQVDIRGLVPGIYLLTVKDGNDGRIAKRLKLIKL